MIITITPHCPKEIDEGKNLGHAYNECMKRLNKDDHACFIDHDAMFTTLHWYRQLEDIIQENKNIGVLSAMTNRIGIEDQRLFQPNSVQAHDHDIQFHRETGEQLYQAHKNTTKKAKNQLAGLMFLTSKAVWQQLGGFCDGFLGVDYDYCFRAKERGYDVLIAKGIYVYHWYRDGKSHLKPSHGFNLPAIQNRR